MTTTETIFAAWLFLLTVATLALFAGWVGQRESIALHKVAIRGLHDFRDRVDAKPKRARRTKAELAIARGPTATGGTIDLSTPLAERVFRGTPKKPGGDGGESAA